MIYFDYSANTPIDNAVLNTFIEATKKYTANPNSTHYLGKLAKQQIDNTSSYIASHFNCNADGVIYTSSASEANNLVFKGIADKYKDKGNHIIISAMEHSSIVAPCNYLLSLGYDVSVIHTNKNGIVDLNELNNTISDKTILVSICSIDSELGVIQPIKEIGDIIKKYKNCVFHTDATQAIGKVNISFSTNISQTVDSSVSNSAHCIDFSNVDFVTFTPHKFYGLNGLGVLINRYNRTITPLIHGGKSTTPYRSGSPDTANILSLNTALKIALGCLDSRYTYVSDLNKMLRDSLIKYDCIHINSPINASPYILNFSIINRDINMIMSALNENGVYVSRTSACSLDSLPSRSVFSLTGDEMLSKNTIRLSLSHLNTKAEIVEFLKILDLIL